MFALWLKINAPLDTQLYSVPAAIPFGLGMRDMESCAQCQCDDGRLAKPSKIIILGSNLNSTGFKRVVPVSPQTGMKYLTIGYRSKIFCELLQQEDKE